MALVAFAAAAPEPPVWQPVFQQTFTETVKYPAKKLATTTGTYYYDVSNPTDKVYRIDRANGVHDRYCGLTHHLTDQPCNQYVKNGDRYLHYPETNECCYCCSADHGCGVLTPNWMSDSDFVGTAEVSGVQTYQWNKVGSQDNFYFETTETDPLQRIPIEIDMGAGSTTEFIQYQDKATFTTTVNPQVFVLPSTCSKSIACPSTSICARLISGGFLQ